MSVADSIRKRIIADLAADLANINGEAGGYHYDLTSGGQRVFIYGRHPTEIPDVPAVVIYQSGESMDDGERIGSFRHTLEIELACFIEEGDIAQASDSVCDFLADVERKLMVDYTRGGLATDTKIIGNVTMLNEDLLPHIAFVIRAQIRFWTSATDPTVVTPAA